MMCTKASFDVTLGNPSCPGQVQHSQKRVDGVGFWMKKNAKCEIQYRMQRHYPIRWDNCACCRTRILFSAPETYCLVLNKCKWRWQPGAWIGQLATSCCASESYFKFSTNATTLPCAAHVPTRYSTTQLPSHFACSLAALPDPLCGATGARGALSAGYKSVQS